MRAILLCLLSLSLPVGAEPVTAPAPASASEAAPPGPSATPLRARLDKDTIRAAIEADPAGKDAGPRRNEADTLSATPYDHFSKAFAGARLPDCLHADGLKRQPTFFLSGVLALPFIAVARVRGVCR
jgi:hypothetical protein